MARMNNKPPNGIPDNAEFGQLRAYLAINGWSQAQINNAVGTAPNGRTRAEIADQLAEWIKNGGN